MAADASVGPPSPWQAAGPLARVGGGEAAPWPLLTQLAIPDPPSPSGPRLRPGPRPSRARLRSSPAGPRRRPRWRRLSHTHWPRIPGCSHSGPDRPMPPLLLLVTPALPPGQLRQAAAVPIPLAVGPNPLSTRQSSHCWSAWTLGCTAPTPSVELAGRRPPAVLHGVAVSGSPAAGSFPLLRPLPSSPTGAGSRPGSLAGLTVPGYTAGCSRRQTPGCTYSGPGSADPG